MSLFGTAGVRGDVVETLTPELALEVGRAAGIEASSENGGSGARNSTETFAVARDGRTTGRALADAVSAGLASSGVDVVRCGVLPTPALAWMSRGRRGVMVTASHNPPADNGLKLFEDGVEYDDDAEDRIEDRVAGETTPARWSDWGRSETVEAIQGYRDLIRAYASGHGAPLDDSGNSSDALRVAVDCGNGTAGLATPQVLRALGAEVVALEANVDGHFPGRESKPTPESLSDFRAFVAGDDAALGIAHDGDADRIAVVGPDGDVVHEDTIVAILAEHYVAESTAGDPVVVTTPNASGRIDERVEARGGRVERVRLGALHEGIAAARAAEDADTEVVFAAEPWKHVHPGLGGWIDGVASAAVLARLVADAGGIGALREPVAERPYRKANVECPDGRKAPAMARIEEALPARFPEATVDTRHGVRVDLPDGSWVLVRPSGTEPYLRVYAESERVADLIEEVRDVVEESVASVEC
jgi:phosphomannomutase